jgi:hypothetical protein
MLNWFRDKAKIFLIAIIVTFVILIFVDWGTGRMRNSQSASISIATIDGARMPPELYDESFRVVYARLEAQMQQQGNPSPTSELETMSETIAEASFQEMIETQLEKRYLDHRGWPSAGRAQAAALMRAQIALSGIEDPDAYYAQYSASPGFTAMLDQYVAQIRMIMFPAAARMQNMASSAELEYYIMANYVPITARYVTFRSPIQTPDEAALRSFYDSHPELFTDLPHSRIRYVVIGVQPDGQDFDRALAIVDSLALAGGSADTIVMTRENVLSFTGLDSLTPQGVPSRPFVAPSLRGGMLQSVHEVAVLTVVPRPGDRTGAADTVTVVHWEQPVLPGPDAIRVALYAAEDSRATILSMEVPTTDSLMVLDWGDLYVEESSPIPADFPQSLSAFALDSVWTDSIGPAFFIPSFRGGYPAFLVAKRIETSFDTTMVSYDEAMNSNRLLLTAYSEIQADSSMALADRMMQSMAERGLTLGMYAQAESLEIATTTEFTASATRQASLGDPEAYGGILCSGDFGAAALVAPLLTPIGPFRTGGSAVIAEISSRSEMPMPGDPAVLAPMYLTVQGQHSYPAIRMLVEQLRRSSEVVDLRKQYEAAMDSLRSSGQQQPQAPPIDY